MANGCVIILFMWGLICYIVGLASPWAYLSIKNAYGDNLGITDAGKSFVPEAVQNKTCSTKKMTVDIFKGICTDGISGDCNKFDDKDYWSAVDSVNEMYTDFYKHSIPTNFEDDAATWSIIKALLIFSLIGLVLVLAVYTYFHNRGDVELTVKVNKRLAGALVLTSAASFTAVGLSLSTYALSHQFYTGGAYYVKSWFVYSEFVQGCEGPQYLPGPGIFMHPFGGVTVFILASLLPYLSPRADIGTQADSVPVAAAAVANPVAEAAATEVYVVTSA